MQIQEFLLQELTKRQTHNPSYSLRSFAHSLHISPTLLSQLITGHRPLTFRTAKIISEQLELDEKTKNKLEDSIIIKQKKNKIKRKPKNLLSVEEFKVISDWEHFAILALADIPDNRSDPSWIANRLGISKKRSNEILTRLAKLNYIYHENSHFRANKQRLRTQSDQPSIAVRKYHRQNLELAAKTLSEESVENRYFGSLTMAIDPKQLPLLKKLIRKFRENLDNKTEKMEAKRVYHFSVQLFPIDKGEETNEKYNNSN